MKTFAFRRAVGASVTIAITVIMVAVYLVSRATLRPDGFVSGWILLGLILFLAAYNVRKVFTFLPLGSSVSWLQFHIYAGILTFVVFLMHVRFSVPNGFFELLLMAVYLSVFLSGLAGLYMSRTFPRRLTNLGNEVVFEHIPAVRRRLLEDIEALVLRCDEESGTSAVTDFYRNAIRPFMTGPPKVMSHLFRGSSAEWRSLMRALEDQHRYLNESERAVLDDVRNLVCRKHQLDTQYTLQGALKVWLFFHIPATWVLLIFAFFHSLLVHAWYGGVQ